MDYVKLLRDELDQHKLKSAEGSGGSGNREESNIIAKLDEIIKNNHPRETTVEQPKKTNGNFSLTSDREKERQTVQQQSATDRALQEAVTQKNNALAVNDNLSYEEKLSNLRGQKHQAKKDKISAAIDSILGQVTVDEGRINQAQQDYNAASQRLKDSKTALADLKKNKWDETQKYNQNQLEQNAELKSLVAMAYKAKLNADMAQTTKANLYPGNAAAAQTGLDPASVANSQAVRDYNQYFKKIEEMGYDANSLLDTYTRNSNQQLTEQIADKTGNFADKHPVIASGAHVALNAFQAPAMEDIVRTGLQSAISDEYIPIDTNAPTFAATNVRDSISGQVTGDIQQKVIDKTDNETLANAAVFLYQTGLSIGDFASVAALPQPASLAIMGTSAAVSTAKDATERGISADKAALTAIAAGASEIIFEKLSLENLNALKATGRSGVENTVKDILKQTFTEGSEEVFTDIANAISDQIINGDNSAIMQNYRKFIDEGMSEGEARKQTAISFGKQIGESFLGGAISGGIMGAGGVAYGNIAQTNYYRAVGNEIKQNGTAQDVINTGLNTDTQSKTYQAAMELQSRLERSSYDNNSESADYSVLSSKKLGQLQLANENLGSQTNLINAVADSNQAPLTAVSKFAAGEKLNSKDVSAIKNSDVAIDAINQEYGTNLTSDNISKFELNQLSDTVSKNVAYPFKRNYSAENAKKNSVSYNIPATDKFGKPVDITDISVEQGNVVVTTADNEKINSNDLNFQNSETTELFERAAVYPTNAAKSFIAGYDYSSEQSVRDYAIGFSDIYIDTARSGATANMTAETAIAVGADKNLAPQQAFLAYSAAVNEFKGGNKGKSKAVKNNGNIKAQFDAALKSNTVGTTVIGTPKTSMQNAEIALLDEVAKNNNLSVIVVDSVQDVMNEDSNAAAVNDKIVIGLDTQNGMLLPYAGHELFHILKENKNSSATAKELQSFIIDVLKNDASYNYGERFNELQSAYKFKGTDAEITDMINEEIAANACFTVLSNEKNFNSLVKQNKSLAQRVYDFFADFLNQIKERLVTLAKQNKEYKALHNEYKIQDKIVSMMKTALGEYQKNNTATNDSVASTGIKFSKKMDDYSYDERKIIDGYLEAVDNEILQFYNNAINKIPQVPKINIGKVTSKMSDEILEVLGIDTTGWNIKFEDRIAKHIDKDHGANGITDKSMSNSNDVARMKFIIDNHDYYGSPATTRAYKINVNGFNKNAPTITFAKKINGTYYLVMAVPKNKTLWIVTAFMNKKIEAAQFRNASNETLRHTAKTDAASTSINTVSQTDTDVNNNSMQNSSKYSLRDSDGNELTEQQQEYFKDSKVRDENGNLLVMYHGTPNEFTVFKNKGDGSYFTPDKEYASGYTQAMNDFDGYVMSVYLNITKPFDINDKKTKDIFINEYIKGGWAQGISPYSTDAEINKYIERGLDWTEGSNLIEFIEENELDYDGLIIDEGSFADGDWEYSGKGANAKWRGYSYVIFNSNQAKNINNTNPTDNEDIRFSLRDSQYEKAVNTNDLETAQKLVDESAVLWGALTDENGNPLRVYHGTTNFEEQSVWNEKTKTFDTDYKKFTVFKNQYDEQTGHFFNSNADNAGGYGSTLYEVYLKMNKPLVINCKNANYSAVSYKGQIKDTYEWAEYAKNNGYDGVIFKNIRDGVDYGDLQSSTDDYVVFNSSQIKSAEPVTYDNSGNVISLSKRFSFYQDIRFSLKEPVEQTKDLIAVHNVTEDKLLNSLKLGGLPSPSIAVMKARMVDANANFGNISLVFHRNTIDPQADSDNKLYSSDAYTPISVQPEYKLNEKKANDLYSKIRELSNKKAAFKKNSVEFHVDNLTDRINRAGGLNNLLTEYQKDYGMKQLFLAATGNQIEKAVQKTIEIYNSDELAAIKSISMQLKDVLSTVTIDKIDREFIVDNSAIIEKVEELKGKKVFEKCLELFAAKSYLDGTLEKTKNVDNVEATEKAIDSRVNQKEYEKWLNDLFAGVVEKKGIRNNVDTYTASGNRRSWEKLYWDYNLENIVKAMKEQNAQGGNFLVSNIFGGSAQRFNSIDELKDNANRLQKIDDEEYEQIRKILNSRFNEICNSMDKHNNPFAIADVVVEALSKYKTKSGIANYMKAQLKGWAEYSDAAMDDIWNLVCDIRALPVNYFEAKPQRAVYFNEVYTAVIPDKSSKELINALDNANVNYQTYEDGNEQSRMDLLNSLDDVKFSMRENNKDVEKLLKENAQLQDANELLRQELQLTKGHRLNQSNIKSIAKSFIKKYGAYELDEQTLYNKLSALYDYMANAGSMIDDRYIWSVANDIAKNIIKVSTVKDTEFYNEYKPLKKRLRETAVTVPADVRREVSSYSNINKLRIRNNGSIALDSFYNELAADYPELFDSSVLSEADQLSRIIEVYESIAPIYTDRLSQSGYTLEEYSSIVAAEIFDKYFNVKEMPTFADKKQQELEQLKLHYSNAIDDMRKQYDKRYNERERQLKEKLKNVNARNQQKLIKQQAHFTEMSLNAFHRKRRTIAKNKIANVKKDLTRRLLNPTETSYVPMSLVQKIADICDLINETQIKDKNNFDRSQNIINELQLLHSAYEELKTYPDVDYASEYEQEMGTKISLLKNALEQSITDSDSGTLQISQLDYPQLEDIYHILRDIKNALVDATYQIGLDERISNHQRGIKIINELNVTKGWRNTHIGRYEMETLNPVRAVRKITEYNDDAELYKLVNELNLGQRKADKFISDASKPFYKLRQQAKEFTRFSSVEVETNIVDKNGNKVKMTENEIVQLIMTMKRRQGKNHLKEKGFILPDRKLLKKGKYKNALAQGTVIERLNPYEVMKMYDSLSDYAKTWVSASQYLFNEQGKNAINETSMLLKHKKIATAENYIPIQVDTDFTSKEIQGLKFDGTIEGMGSLKSVVNKANQPLVIQGLNTVVDKHINDVSKYYGLAIPIRNFNKVFGVQTSDVHDLNLGRNTVRVALRTKWGDAGLKLFDNLITDLQTGRSTGGKSMASEILDKVQSGFVQATLASNISVTIKQAASYPTALANLSGKSLGVGLPVFGYNAKQLDKLFAEIDEHTGIHFKRRIGMSSQELGELTKENAFINKIPATINPMKWIQAMDVKTTAALWVAAKYDVKKLYPDIKVNSEAYFEKVTSLYEETIENTQPNYDILHRPELQKEKGIMRSIAMFKTQPLQNTGILYDSLFEYRKKHSEYNKNKTDENKFALEQAQRKFRKAVISQFLASVTFSAMSMLAAMARHTMYGYRDDDDEVTWKSIVAGLMNSMASLFFTLLAPVGGGELYEFTKSLGDGYTSDFVSVPVVTTINDLCSSINKVVKTANGVVDGENEPKDLLSSVENLGYSVATIFGVPVKNAVNYSKGIVANIKDAVNGEFGKFEAGVNRKPKQNVDRYGKYLTGDSYKENPSKAKEILDEMISDKKEALLAAGETTDEAEKKARESVRSSFSSYYKKQYQEAFSKKDAEKRRQIINILKSTGLFVYETKRTLADVISDWEEETKK